jgi:hypothetical protein
MTANSKTRISECGNYIFKTVTGNQPDERIYREIQSRRILGDICPDLNIPNIISVSDGTLQMEYVKPGRDRISEQQFSDYWALILNQKAPPYRCHFATQATFDTFSILQDINLRLRQLKSLGQQKIEESQRLLERALLEVDCNINFLCTDCLFSQSDSGIQNMISDKQNKLHVIDWEYAGLDATLRALIDNLFHPKNAEIVGVSVSLLETYLRTGQKIQKSHFEQWCGLLNIRWGAIVAKFNQNKPKDDLQDMIVTLLRRNCELVRNIL